MKDIRSEVEGFDGHNLLSVKVLLSELEAHLSREPMTSECLTNTTGSVHEPGNMVWLCLQLDLHVPSTRGRQTSHKLIKYHCDSLNQDPQTKLSSPCWNQ